MLIDYKICPHNSQYTLKILRISHSFTESAKEQYVNTNQMCTIILEEYIDFKWLVCKIRSNGNRKQ